MAPSTVSQVLAALLVVVFVGSVIGYTLWTYKGADQPPSLLNGPSQPARRNRARDRLSLAELGWAQVSAPETPESRSTESFGSRAVVRLGKWIAPIKSFSF